MPSVSPKEFNIFMRATKKLPEKSVKSLLHRSALAVFRDVTKFTPVDTGRAKGSWSVVINQPVPTVDAGDVGGDPGASGLNVAMAAKIAGAPAFSRINISNTISYIGVLNDGGPSRPPHGMVEKALTNLRRQLARRKTIRVT